MIKLWTNLVQMFSWYLKEDEETGTNSTNGYEPAWYTEPSTGRYWTGFDPECLKKKSGNGDKKRMDL